MITWSIRLILISFAESFKTLVILSSSLLGRVFPLGWLCTRTIAAALDNKASFSAIRTSKAQDVMPPLANLSS